VQRARERQGHAAAHGRGRGSVAAAAAPLAALPGATKPAAMVSHSVRARSVVVSRSCWRVRSAAGPAPTRARLPAAGRLNRIRTGPALRWAGGVIEVQGANDGS
jgi:hypothetical protein